MTAFGAIQDLELSRRGRHPARLDTRRTLEPDGVLLQTLLETLLVDRGTSGPGNLELSLCLGRVFNLPMVLKGGKQTSRLLIIWVGKTQTFEGSSILNAGGLGEA